MKPAAPPQKSSSGALKFVIVGALLAIIILVVLVLLLLLAVAVGLGACLLAASYALTAYLFGPASWAAIFGGLCIFGVAVYIAHLPVLGSAQKRPADA